MKYKSVKIGSKEYAGDRQIESVLASKSIYWLNDCEFEDAEIQIDRGKVIWKDGTWYNGTWFGDIWENGDWYYGVWTKGVWTGGTFHAGTWLDGVFELGNFMHGEVRGGVFKEFKVEEYEKINKN